eukprot:GHVQ01018530.1.p1 GENE.GHVQ01018530.1~~GHVQ01018530.1.p1  ORF type:complete len:110 (+),score=1.98 GHVQ01018530.1:44-373(+)
MLLAYVMLDSFCYLHPGCSLLASVTGTAMLKDLLTHDGSLAKHFKTRRRFFEPLFRRRRLAYLERLSSGRVKNAKKLLYKQYFVDHPDQKELWPDNKGSCSIKWPSPYG